MTSAPARLRLSVHDTVPVWRSSTVSDALGRTIELAQTAESLGFHRYWVAEHHDTPALAASAPAVLAGQILAATGRIRVGSGAVLLPHHSPLAVAEQFGVLAALYPDRVDLGIGRGGGGSAAAAKLSEARDQPFDAQLSELLNYFDPDRVPVVRAVPEPEVAPEFWLVGSSLSSAEYAGALGLPYVYAHTIAPGGSGEALAAYHRAFRPSKLLAAPYTGIAAIVTVARHDRDAIRLASAFVLGQILMRESDPHTTLPTLDDLDRHTFTETQTAFLGERLEPQLIGSVDTVRRKLDRLLQDHPTDELFALTNVPDYAARVTSYELLSSINDSVCSGQ